MTWACNPIFYLYLFKTSTWSAVNFKKTWDLDELHTWARDMVMWYWSADTSFWQVSLIVTWMSNIKEVNGKQMLHVSVNLLGVWPPSCATLSSSSSSWLCVRAHKQYRSPWVSLDFHVHVWGMLLGLRLAALRAAGALLLPSVRYRLFIGLWTNLIVLIAK